MIDLPFEPRITLKTILTTPRTITSRFTTELYYDPDNFNREIAIRSQDNLYNITDVRFFARGGSSTILVGKMESEGISAKVAIKVEPFQGDKCRVLKEAEVLNQLSHVAMPTVIANGVIEWDSLMTTSLTHHAGFGRDLFGVMVTEFFPYCLDDLIIKGMGVVNEHGILDRHILKSVALNVGRALQYVHSRGIIHRDVKPSNILLDDLLEATLADFGVCTLIEGISDEIAIGSPGYLSPEEVDPKKSIDPSADVYSFGVVLYEMLTGKPLYKFNTTGEALQKAQKFVFKRDLLPENDLLSKGLDKEAVDKLSDFFGYIFSRSLVLRYKSPLIAALDFIQIIDPDFKIEG